MKRHLYRFGFQLAKLYWFVRRPHSQGSVAIIHFKQQILLIRNTYGHARWVFPGGGIKPGESPSEAARREVKEEVGIDLSEVKFIGTHVFNENFRLDTVHYFEAHAKGPTLTLDPDEIAEGKWFELSSLPTKLGISTTRGLELAKNHR